MAKINVYCNEMSALSVRLKKIAGVIADAERITGKVQRNLDFQVAAKQGIAGGLSAAKGKLQRQGDKVGKLSALTASAEEEFCRADGQMDKKARYLLGIIFRPAASVTPHALGDFFAGISLTQHRNICSLFSSAGTIIKAAGLGELIRRLREAARKQYAGSGKTASGTKTAAAQKPSTKPVNSPAVVNTGSSKQNAENVGLTYYTQGKGYNKYWDERLWIGSDGKQYAYIKRDGTATHKVSCDICCASMAAAYFGAKQLTPGVLLQATGGNPAYNVTSAKKEMAKYGISAETVAKNSDSAKTKVNKLDECLEKYRNDPTHNAPPMISIYNKNNKNANHYVMVVGKDKNGNYIIVDPANDDRTILKVNSEGYGQKMANAKGYESTIKTVVAWTKK